MILLVIDLTLDKFQSFVYNVVTCQAGFYLNNGQCEECPIGFYKPIDGNTNCTSCPENTTTEAVGAVVEKQCSEY